jgi:hypothetical protein
MHAHVQKPKQSHRRRRRVPQSCYAPSPAHAAFFGVAFLGVFLGAAFLCVDALAGVLVTRPDLVLLMTLGTSTTAGAYRVRCVKEDS